MDVYIYPKSKCCNDRFWPIPIPKIMGNLWETIVKHMVEFWEEWLRSSKKCSNSGEIWRESKRQFIWYRFRQGGGPQNNFLSLLVASMFWVNGRCCHVCKPDRTRPQGSRWPIRTVKIPMDQLYFLVVSTSSNRTEVKLDLKKIYGQWCFLKFGFLSLWSRRRCFMGDTSRFVQGRAW